MGSISRTIRRMSCEHLEAFCLRAATAKQWKHQQPTLGSGWGRNGGMERDCEGRHVQWHLVKLPVMSLCLSLNGKASSPSPHLTLAFSLCICLYVSLLPANQLHCLSATARKRLFLFLCTFRVSVAAAAAAAAYFISLRTFFFGSCSRLWGLAGSPPAHLCVC